MPGGRGPAAVLGLIMVPLAKHRFDLFNRAVLQQQTLKQAASLAGIGLHSGNRVNMTFLPAAAHTGIRFRRTDLEGKPEIEARIENVSDTSRSTTISKGNAKIQTTEHVLAAFAGFGIDNIIVELDANEPPIGDGSSQPYCRLIEKAGIVAQPAERENFQLTHPIEIELGDAMISAFPHDRLKLSCTSADRHGRYTQFLSLEITPENWQRELAGARTFCFYDEIEFLIKNGLIRGGSLENAVVIRDDAVLTTEPLRFPDEFVRHKMLDILGDLQLLGRSLQAHIVAIKPSHAANCELARVLNDQMRKPWIATQTFTPPPENRGAEAAGEAQALVRDGASLDIEQVLKILPHRYPFLMIDRVLEINGNRIRAMKNISINEPYFAGHFPNHPIMPGVLQLEAIAQAAGIVTLKQAEHFGKLAYFMSAESVKWRKPVRPGDTLIIEVELTKARGKVGKAKGKCLVNGEVVSEAEVTYMLVEK